MIEYNYKETKCSEYRMVVSVEILLNIYYSVRQRIVYADKRLVNNNNTI